MYIPILVIILCCIILLPLGAVSARWIYRRTVLKDRRRFVDHEKVLQMLSEELKLQKEVIEQKTQALQKAEYATAHYWENPTYKTFRGLRIAIDREFTEVFLIVDEMELQGHDVTELRKELLEIKKIWDIAVDICLKLEAELKSRHENFNQ